ncbi:MAG: hypothetical protein R3A80_00945 [Bdellovibrionota bacterium]
MSVNNEDKLWEQVFEVLGSDDRLKRFLRIPRHEVVGFMKAHGTDLSEKIFILFRLIEKGYQPRPLVLFCIGVITKPLP